MGKQRHKDEEADADAGTIRTHPLGAVALSCGAAGRCIPATIHADETVYV